MVMDKIGKSQIYVGLGDRAIELIRKNDENNKATSRDVDELKL